MVMGSRETSGDYAVVFLSWPVERSGYSYIFKDDYFGLMTTSLNGVKLSGTC